MSTTRKLSKKLLLDILFSMLTALLLVFLLGLVKGKEGFFVPAQEIAIQLSDFNELQNRNVEQKKSFYQQRGLGTICTNDQNCPTGQACCFDLIGAYNGTCYDPTTTFCCVDDGNLLSKSLTNVPSLFTLHL